jgi:signal transduction histidine kinase
MATCSDALDMERHSMKNRIQPDRTLIVCSILILVLMLSLAFFWRNPARGLPYSDTFSAGKADEWKAFGGTWELTHGAMRNDSDERGAKLLTGSTRWQNYSIEADVMLLGLGGDAGLIIRSTHEQEGVDAYHGYYAGLRTIDNSLALGRADYGWTEIGFPLAPRGLQVHASQWYHLKVLAWGCQLVASVNLPHQPVLMAASITDPGCLRSGRAGLRSYSSGGVWRNISIRPVTRGDLDRMLSGAPKTNPAELSGANTSPPGVSLSPPAENRPQALLSSRNSVPISSIRFASVANPVTATVRGIVILTSPALFVQDATGGVSVRQRQPEPLKVGDEVEVTGTVNPHAFSSTLDDATVRVLWEGTPTPAVSVTAAQAATGAFDATFIEVSGRLTQKEAGPGDSLVFDLDSGSQKFRAIFNRGRGNSLYRELQPGSVLRLRGVAVADPTYTGFNTPFAILVRSSDDFGLLAGPPWWSPEHIAATIITLFASLLWLNFLYRRLETVRLRAALEEREHLAYEMHDTLAQSVAGIGFQLEAIRIGTPEELSKVHRQIDFASQLVRHSHAEARRSIEMLRPRQIESEGLLNALTQCVRRLVEEGSIQIVAGSTGEVRELPLRIADSLYRIGQEALANAVRHARSSKIAIYLTYQAHGIRMVISDDGTGFAIGDDLDQQDLRGFGLQGMRKRAASIFATLEIISKVGEGTQVVVNAPLAPRITWLAWPTSLQLFFRKLDRICRNVLDQFAS